MRGHWGGGAHFSLGRPLAPRRTAPASLMAHLSPQPNRRHCALYMVYQLWAYQSFSRCNKNVVGAFRSCLLR